ncbi:MAG: hypothetical protein IAF38_09425 [Bacteroidia bacterium]|nr:hypothetical protein [Bacteroidia bacterium]
MKQILILFFFLSFLSSKAQDYFEAESLYDKDKFEEAGKTLENVLEKGVYKNDTRFLIMSMNLFSDVKRILKDSVGSEKINRQILEVVPVPADSGWANQINSEKYKACMNLFSVSMKRKNYSEAIHYLRLTETHAYYSATGIDVALERITLRFNFAEVYERLNFPDSALIQLIPNMEFYDLCCEAGALAKVIRIVKSKYSKQEIKKMFKQTELELKAGCRPLLFGLEKVNVERLVRPLTKDKPTNCEVLFKTSYLYLELKKLIE